MGACKVDIHEKGRQYAVKYALNDAAGVRALLRDRHDISSRRFRGDTAASDILIDLHSAMNSAGLSDRQTEAIAWVYGAGVTQADAGRIMGVTQQAVAAALDDAVTKIAAVYQRWNYGEIEVVAE